MKRCLFLPTLSRPIATYDFHKLVFDEYLVDMLEETSDSHTDQMKQFEIILFK